MFNFGPVGAQQPILVSCAERMRCLLPLWLGASLPGLLWAAAVLLVEGDSDPSRICKPAPHWEVGGIAPMPELLGNVVVVALLKAS